MIKELVFASAVLCMAPCFQISPVFRLENENKIEQPCAEYDVCNMDLSQIRAMQITQRQYSLYNIPLDDSTQKIIQDIAKEYNIDSKIILGVASVESDFDPFAVGDNGDAEGMYQIQRRWWQWLLDENGINDLYDIEQSTRACCLILKELYNEYKYTDMVLCAYNSGKPESEKGKVYTEKVMNAIRSFDNEL